MTLTGVPPSAAILMIGVKPFLRTLGILEISNLDYRDILFPYHYHANVPPQANDWSLFLTSFPVTLYLQFSEPFPRAFLPKFQ